MSALLAIAVQMFRDALRQPTAGVVVVIALSAEAIGPYITLFALRGERALLADFGLSTLLVSSWVVAALGATSAVRSEIESRTALVLFSKPVARPVFLLGKFLGLSAALVTVAATLALSLLIAVRQGPAGANGSPLDLPAAITVAMLPVLTLLVAFLRALLGRRSFGAGIGPSAFLVVAPSFLLVGFFGPTASLEPWGGGYDPLVARAAFLALLAVLILASLAVLLSVWVGRAGTLALTAGFFVLGLVRTSLPHPWSVWLAIAPDFRLYCAGDLFYSSGATLPFSYLAWTAAHAASYIALVLTAAACALERKSFG